MKAAAKTLVSAGLLLCALGSPARAAQKVILLTSVNGVAMAEATPSFLFWLRSRYYSMNERLENEVRGHFRGTGVEVEALHYADLSVLYRVLHSPDYAAVYWVSHGANPKGNAATQNGGLYDYQTFDVSPLLREINPNLRLLALVSCYSKTNLKHLQADSEGPAGSPGLTFLTFGGEVEEMAGLNAALAKGDGVLAQETGTGDRNDSPAKQPGIFVGLTRTCQKPGPSLFVNANGRILTVFPRCEAGESQSENGFIGLAPDDLADLEHGTFDPSTLDVTVSTGAQPVDRVMFAPKPYFGELELSHPEVEGVHFRWKALERAPGIPAGVDHRVFAYQGDAPRLFNVGNFEPFRLQ